MDVGALAVFGVDPAVEEVPAEVGVAGPGVWQEVPDDDQDGAADGENGFVRAAAAGDRPVVLAREAAGVGGSDGGFAQDAGQVGVAVPGGALASLLFLPAGSFTPG